MSHDSIISSFTTDSASSTAQGGTDLVDIVPHSPLKRYLYSAMYGKKTVSRNGFEIILSFSHIGRNGVFWALEKLIAKVTRCQRNVDLFSETE